MSKTVKVTYNADTLETTIIVDGKDFDTSRINGKEIADWAYPFVVRKVRWDGFYDEMVAALGGEKAFDLVFEGSDEALAELKEAWEDAPVNVVSGEQGNTVSIAYDADARTTEITVNGQPFDTTRINGKEIEDWVYPFMMRKIKWDGIFDELKAVLGTDEYEIQFSGTRAAMKALMEDCPEAVRISYSNSTIENINDNKQSKTVVYTVRLKNSGTTPMATVKVIKDMVTSDLKEAKTLSDNAPIDLLKGVSEEAANELCVALKKAGAVVTIHTDSVSNEEQDHSLDKTAEENADSPVIANATASTDDEADELEGQAYELFQNERYVDAFSLRKKAAEMGNINAISNLGVHYYFGYGVEQDYEAALKYYKQAADLGNAWAQNKTGFMYNNGYGCEMDEGIAFSYFMKAAEQEESEAQYWVGMCYKNGWGVPENAEKAYTWFSKSHKNGNTDGTCELASCLWNGYGIAPNKGRAKGLWNEAANKDHAQSAYLIGEAHIEEDNNNKAFFYLNKAYKLGYRDAAGSLALCLEMGWGTQANYRKAVGILEENLDNHPEYYVQLGKIFFPMNTNYHDYTKAAQYFQQAVEHGYVEGYYMLGICYSEGYGVPKDKDKAKELLQVAADNGHTEAQNYINNMIKTEGYIDTAKKIGKGALGLLGAIAQGYIQASGNMYDDEDE